MKNIYKIAIVNVFILSAVGSYAQFRISPNATICRGQSTTLTVSGAQKGNALQFNGRQYVSLPVINVGDTVGFTVEAWVKPSDIASNAAYDIIRQDGADYPNWLLAFQQNGKYLTFGIASGGQYQELRMPINPSDYTNGWHHIAATYDGAFQRLYVDGVLVDTLAKTGFLDHIGTTHDIGSDANTAEFYQGQIDEVRIWSVARTQPQIVAAEDRYLGPTPYLVAEWAMDECTGSIVKDGSGNGYNGTLSDSAGMRVQPSTSPVSPTYLWSPSTGLNTAIGDSVSASPSATTTYTVTVEGTAECLQLDTAQVTVFVKTCSGLIITYDKDTVCTGDPAHLHVTGGAGGNALKFNGTSDHVQLPLIDISKGTGLTVEAWVDVTSATSTSYQNVIRQSGGNTGGGYPNWMLEFQNSTSPDLAFGINAGGSYTEMRYSITPSYFSGSWHHIAGTYDGTFMRLYVDGQMVDSMPKSGSVGFVGSDHSIGSNANFFEFYQGFIDEVRLWDAPRTQAQIQAAMHSYLGPTQHLVAEWSMDECAGSVVKDHSGNGYDGTLSDSSTMRVEPSTAPVYPIYVWHPSTGLDTTVGADVTASPKTTTTYVVVAEGSTDCNAADSAMVTIVDTCTGDGLIVTAASDTICKNDSTLMTVIGAHKGNALRFNGTSDHVTLPLINISGGTGLTVEAWVNIASIDSSYQNVFRQSGGNDSSSGDPNWLLEFQNVESPSLAFGVYTTNGFTEMGVPIVSDTFPGKWHHIAGTYDGAFMRLYIDGNLVDSLSYTGAVVYTGTQNSIGSNANSIEFYQGQIDEVRLWDVARTQAQIRQSMFSAIGPNEVHLKGEWAMDDCSGATVADITGDGYDGTLSDTAMRVAPSTSPVKPFYIWNPATGLDPAWGDTVYANPKQTTTYIVSALGANCKSLEGGKTIIVENCDGVKESGNIPESAALFVYPNPAHGNVNVQYNAGTITDLTVRIVNVLGETVYSESYGRFFGAYNQNIDVSSLSRGTYYLQIIADKETAVKSIVLK